MGKNKVEGNPNLYFSFFLLIGKSLLLNSAVIHFCLCVEWVKVSFENL